MRLVGFFVAKMPLAEDAGPVVGLLEYFCECFRLERHPFAFENGMRDSISHRMPPSHECRASGRAGGTDEKARQPRTLIVKLRPDAVFRSRGARVDRSAHIPGRP